MPLPPCDPLPSCLAVTAVTHKEPLWCHFGGEGALQKSPSRGHGQREELSQQDVLLFPSVKPRVFYPAISKELKKINQWHYLCFVQTEGRQQS